MTDTTPTDTPKVDVAQIIESAKRMGIELNEVETQAWLAALDDTTAVEVTVDEKAGIFGHRVSMLDFSPRDLARFRRIGEVVEVKGPAGVAESALALSGSAAQSKIQSYPGDCDYFERLNIKAPSREAACDIMATLLRDHVFANARGATHQFLEAKLGSYPTDCIHRGKQYSKGSPISWKFEEIEAGEVVLESAEHGTTTLSWSQAALDPGWVKLDWVVADPERHQLSNASNVIDVTWEAPDGEIISLDGYLDAYFQEVYLDSDALPTFAKVAQFVSEDALDDYVDRLEEEVHKYLTRHLNYGKAAKRMYNIFRLSGRHLDAAFVRELFDEPSTILYQVWSLIGTLENASQPGSSIPIEDVQRQADELIMLVTQALDGAEESEIVKALLQLRRTLDNHKLGEERSAEVEAAQTQVVNLVNTFFHDRLVAMPTIDEYIQQVQAQP